MSSKRIFLLAGGLVLAAALAGGSWWWHSASVTRDFVTQTLPPIPDLISASSSGQEAIRAADQRARSLGSARAGLAELSRVYHANGFLEAAMHCYEGLEELEPAEPRWPHRHAIILAGFGELEPAMELWHRVIQLAPDYTVARLRLADSLLKINRIPEAAAAYQEILQHQPQNPYAQLGLARIDFEAGRWQEARARLEPLVIQTKFELGYDLIVSIYERLGEHRRAAEIRGTMKAFGAYRDPADPWIDELLDVCYDPYRLSVAAGTMAKEAAERSAELLDRAIQLAPTDVSNYYQQGMLALQGRNLLKAREWFERCTTLSPDFSDGWAQLSGLQHQLGDTLTAQRTLERGLQHCPNSPGLHLMKARNLRDAGRVEEAIAEFKHSSELRPNEAEAYLDLGSMLISLGRNEEGMEQIQLAVIAEPGNPMAIGILAFNAIMQGDEREARQWMTRAKAQPRVLLGQLEKLEDAFKTQFGRAP